MSLPYFVPLPTEQLEYLDSDQQDYQLIVSPNERQSAPYPSQCFSPYPIPQQGQMERVPYCQQVQQYYQQQYSGCQDMQQSQWMGSHLYPDDVYQQQLNASVHQYTQTSPQGPVPSVCQNAESQLMSIPTVQPAPPLLPDATSCTWNTIGGGSDWEIPEDGEMDIWRMRNRDGSWSCTYPGCVSDARFDRISDLRKHHKRHTKPLRCRYTGCEKAVNRSFSTKKDRNRHEARHDPQIPCSRGCGRVFSREDNMRDHVRRRHEGRKT